MEESKENMICEENDSAEAVIKEFEDRKKKKLDDIIAMQAAVCVIAAVAVICLQFFKPEIAADIVSKLDQCMNDSANTLPDPIDYIMSYFN